MSLDPLARLTPIVTDETTISAGGQPAHQEEMDLDIDALLEEGLKELDGLEEYHVPSAAPNIPAPIMPKTSATLEQGKEEVRLKQLEEVEVAKEMVNSLELQLKGNNISEEDRKKLVDFFLAIIRRDQASTMQAVMNLPLELQDCIMGGFGQSMDVMELKKTSERTFKEIDTYLSQEGISQEVRQICLEFVEAVKLGDLLRSIELEKKLPADLKHKIMQAMQEFMPQTHQQFDETPNELKRLMTELSQTVSEHSDEKPVAGLNKEQQMKGHMQELICKEVENYLAQDNVSPEDRETCLGLLKAIKDQEYLLIENFLKKLPHELNQKIDSKLQEVNPLISFMKDLTPEESSWWDNFDLTIEKSNFAEMATLSKTIPPRIKERIWEGFNINAEIAATQETLDLYKKDKASFERARLPILSPVPPNLQSKILQILNNSLSLLNMTLENDYSIEKYLKAILLGSNDLLIENPKLVGPYVEFQKVFVRLCDSVDAFVMFLKTLTIKDQEELLPKYRYNILQQLRKS